MISFKSMQSHVDNAYGRARTDMDDAIEGAAENPSIEDLMAFNDASQQASVANIVNNESLRANHSITKAIIDGIQ
ncbi:type III secretion protein [Pseudomonas sp. efr-133-TYG-103a]|uniref:type III secretion protein n=1 Tax=Pseudomonas sp. efr-133-TYG-103a TaxID=3040308 RepID=UPI002552E24C|nr:type III secretion protein [Pseudomonas sp. efr-133-TYG-103a]